MKARAFFLIRAIVISGAVWAATGINYDGAALELNNDFTRTECGTQKKKTMKEISGLACSRQTPGYIWEHGDENTGDERRILAIKPDGTQQMEVKITTSSTRDDWEDIATGVYDGKNYIFIGAIGDNDLAFKDQYYIYYFEEPAITSGSISVNAGEIQFGYPDGKAYNTETLMYDNIDQMFYIATKVDGVCSLYSLPFKTSYSGKQTLTKVCDLGNGSVFNLCTGGDITPDGNWMAIKNGQYILLWERQGIESLSETVKRRPTQIAAYKEEKQGESLAWDDSTTFYTTSDQKKDVPIYKYTRSVDYSIADTIKNSIKKINEVILSNNYSAYISEKEPNIIRGWYLAGQDEPSVKSYKVSEGATWQQNGNTVTLTGADGDSVQYTMDVQPVSPVAYTDEEVVFDGSADEAEWLKSAYGWDNTKKWKFSKTDSDYSREIAGKTHVELFLPACDTVILKAGGSTERNVYFYVNGVQVGEKVTLGKAGTAVAVNQTEPFMLSVVSAQTSGDGGIAAIRMVAGGIAQGITQTEIKHDVIKCIYHGQLLIIRNGTTYNAQGAQIR